MNITFDFSDELFEVEADEPKSKQELIRIPRSPRWKRVPNKRLPRLVPTPPDIVYGKSNLEETVLKFNKVILEDSDDNLYKLLQTQMERQQNAFEDCSMPLASSYKFDAVLSNDERSWDLTGCFIQRWEVDFDDTVTVQLCVDHIPDCEFDI